MYSKQEKQFILDYCFNNACHYYPLNSQDTRWVDNLTDDAILLLQTLKNKGILKERNSSKKAINKEREKYPLIK